MELRRPGPRCSPEERALRHRPIAGIRVDSGQGSSRSLGCVRKPGWTRNLKGWLESRAPLAGLVLENRGRFPAWQRCSSLTGTAPLARRVSPDGKAARAAPHPGFRTHPNLSPDPLESHGRPCPVPARFMTKAPKSAMASPRASCSRKTFRASPCAEAKATVASCPWPSRS